MTEENVKSEETTVSTQEDVTEVKAEKTSAAEVPAAEIFAAEVPAEATPAAEAPATEEPAAEIPAEEAAAEPVSETSDGSAVQEAGPGKTEEPAAETCAPGKAEKKQEEKKEKKKSRLVAFFANAKNGGDLFVKCFLMLLLSTVLAYAGLMIWGLIDKLIPTFYNAPYCAIITAGLFLLVGIILIILMIARYFRNRKRKK